MAHEQSQARFAEGSCYFAPRRCGVQPAQRFIGGRIHGIAERVVLERIAFGDDVPSWIAACRDGAGP